MGRVVVADKDCEQFAKAINHALKGAQQRLNEVGNDAVYGDLITIAEGQQDAALDAGCFVVNPM